MSVKDYRRIDGLWRELAGAAGRGGVAAGVDTSLRTSGSGVLRSPVARVNRTKRSGGRARDTRGKNNPLRSTASITLV